MSYEFSSKSVRFGERGGRFVLIICDVMEVVTLRSFSIPAFTEGQEIYRSSF